MKKLCIISRAALLLHFFVSSTWIQLGVSQVGMSHDVAIIIGGETPIVQEVLPLPTERVVYMLRRELCCLI